MASLALLGFALSACSDLATQPERRAMAGAAAMERGTLPPGAGQPEGEVGTMGQCGHDAPDCELDPIDVKPPTDNCAENPFGENCGWNGGGGEPPEPPREGEPGGGGSPGGGDPTHPQDNCAEGEECEEGPGAFVLCLVAIGANNLGTYSGMYLDYQDAKRTYDQALRSYNYATLAYLNGEISEQEHEAKKKAHDDARDNVNRLVTQANRTAVDVGGGVGVCILAFFLPV